jgi:GTP cyclohydrolase I
MKSNKAEVKVIHSPEEKSLAPAIKEILSVLGEDPQREGLMDTPRRVD